MMDRTNRIEEETYRDKGDGRDKSFCPLYPPSLSILVLPICPSCFKFLPRNRKPHVRATTNYSHESETICSGIIPGRCFRLSRIFGLEKLDMVRMRAGCAHLGAQNLALRRLPDKPARLAHPVSKNRYSTACRRDQKLTPTTTAWKARSSAWTPKTHCISPKRSRRPLSMIFACFHPAIQRFAVALTLKTVGGFSVPEIASAFLSREIRTRMISRAKQKLRAGGIRLRYRARRNPLPARPPS